jgi:hypothetical protein
MTAITLTYDQVKAAARKAYDEKRLTAQNGGTCMYSQVLNGKACVCAVGAAFPPDHPVMTKAGLSGKSVGQLVEAHMLHTTPTDFNMIQALQWEHDNWCDADDSFRSEKAKRKFETLIGVKA